MKQEVAAYNARRDHVLRQDSLSAFMAFASEFGQTFSCDHVAEVAMHKMRTAVRDLPDELRSRSKTWLQAQGYEAWDDGDVGGLHR